MPIYVAEIAGRGLAAFDAGDDTEAAEVRLVDKAFRRDLIVLQNEGRPLWDGKSEIRMRKASPEETAHREPACRLAARLASSSWSQSSILPITMTMTMTLRQ